MIEVVANAPTAAFAQLPPQIGVGTSFQFTDQSTNSPTQWAWDFDDGTTSTQQNPTHTYAAANPANTLTFSTSNGLHATAGY